MKNWRTTAELAAALDVTPRRARTLAATYGVEAVKVGPACLWPPGALRTLRKKRKPQGWQKGRKRK